MSTMNFLALLYPWISLDWVLRYWWNQMDILLRFLLELYCMFLPAAPYENQNPKKIPSGAFGSVHIALPGVPSVHRPRWWWNPRISSDVDTVGARFRFGGEFFFSDFTVGICLVWWPCVDFVVLCCYCFPCRPYVTFFGHGSSLL